MKETLLKISNREMEYCFIVVDQSTLGNLLVVNPMAWEKRLGLMGQFMRDSLKMERNKEKVRINGVRDVFMRENGMKT